MIATGSGDNTARTWDAATGAGLATLRGHGGEVKAVAFAPDGSHCSPPPPTTGPPASGTP